MPDTHIRVGGVWKAISDCSVRVGGAWKQVKKIYIRVGGAWKEVWANWVVTLSTSGHTSFADPPPTVGVQFRSDGTVYNNAGTQLNASTDWIIPNAESTAESFVIRFTNVSKDANFVHSGITPDGTTWYALTTTRIVRGASNNGADAQCVFTAEISADGGSTVLDSANFTLNSNLLI